MLTMPMKTKQNKTKQRQQNKTKEFIKLYKNDSKFSYCKIQSLKFMETDTSPIFQVENVH